MNNYFLTLVLKQDMTEAARTELLDGVKKRVGGTDGKITKEDMWGSRDLSYPIQKQSRGYYAHFELTTDPKLVKDLDKFLKVEDDILRYLLVRV